MTSFCFSSVQLSGRTSILKQKEFFGRIIGSSLSQNHSPSEWFSLYNKSPGCKPGLSVSGFFERFLYTNGRVCYFEGLHHHKNKKNGKECHRSQNKPGQNEDKNQHVSQLIP